MQLISRTDNIDLTCKNVQAMVDFYHGTLGLPFLFPYDPTKGEAAIEAGNLTIYLITTSASERAPRSGADVLENAPGFSGLAFEVANLDEAIRELDGKVEWVGEEIITWKHPSGSWYRYRPFYDPEGNMLYVDEVHKTGVTSQALPLRTGGVGAR